MVYIVKNVILIVKHAQRMDVYLVFLQNSFTQQKHVIIVEIIIILMDNFANLVRIIV